MKTLTKAQSKVLGYIKEYISIHGYPPTVRDICSGVGLKSTSSVHSHLQKLSDGGYIRRDLSKMRAIEVISDDMEYLPSFESSQNTLYIPLLGEIAAGEPIFAEENIEDHLPIHSSFVGSGNHFFLRIKGNSMINAGIFHRDYVLIREQNYADNGDIVAALIGDSATVKTYYREDGQIRLQPENDEMSPIYSRDVEVIGKVKAVIRKM